MTERLASARRADRLAAALGLVALLVFVALVAAPAARWQTGGFAGHFTAARLLAAGPQAMARAYDDDWFRGQVAAAGMPEVRDIFNVQPPTMALLMAPLAPLDAAEARALWIGLSLAALVGSLLLLADALGLAPVWGLAALLPALAFTPVVENIRSGQVYLLLLLLLCLLAWAIIRHGAARPGLADQLGGAALGLALILKTAGAWAWLVLALRRPRLAAWAAGAAALVALVSLPRVGLVPWQEYARLLPALADDPVRYVTAYQTVTSLFGRLLIYDPRWSPQPLADLPWLARSLTVLVSLGALLVSLRVVRPGAPDRRARAAALATVLALVPANGPLAEDHHYTLVLPALLIAGWLAWQGRGRWRHWAWLLGAALLLGAPLPFRQSAEAGGWLTLLAYPRVYGAYLLWGWLVMVQYSEDLL